MVIGVIGEACILFIYMNVHQQLLREQEKMDVALERWNVYNGKTAQLLLSSDVYSELLDDWNESIEGFESELLPLSASGSGKDGKSGAFSSLVSLWNLSRFRIRSIERILEDLPEPLREFSPQYGGLLFALGKIGALSGEAGMNQVFILRTNVRELLSLNDEYYLILSGMVRQVRGSIERRLRSALIAMAGLSTLIILTSLILGTRFSRALARINTDLKEQIRNKVMIQEQLERSKEAAEEADRAKTQFLANISHELRTPLNSIIGYAELNLLPPEKKNGKEYSSFIIRESEKLLYLVNDLLDFAKLEFHKLKLETIDFSIHEMINDTVDMLRLKAERKGLEFSVNVDGEVPEYLSGDPYRLRQVLVNLLDNAIKFTQAGFVALRVVVKERQEKSCILRFDVEDTGIGIPVDIQRRIFESFMQADGSMSRRFGGSGLGTTIARHLVGLMSGAIDLESTPGVGSRFFFTAKFGLSAGKMKKDDTAVPSRSLIPDEAVPPESSDSDECSGAHLLLVDDYPPNVEVALQFLKTAGYRVDLAQDGKKAVAMAMENRYDLILMDIQMPELDGYETTRIIRRDSELNRDVPILALTANAFASDSEKAVSAGMNGLIAKPIRHEALLSAVSSSIAEAQPPETVKSINETAKSVKKKVHPADRSPERGVPLDYRAFVDEIQDEGSARVLIDGYLEAVAAQLPRLRGLLESGDFKTLHREAHSMKGGAMNIMAADFEQAARSLEQAAKERTAGACEGGIGIVEKEYLRLSEYVLRLFRKRNP